MNKKGFSKVVGALILMVIVVFVVAYIFSSKSKAINAIDTMCGPPTSGGMCACCFDPPTSCPADLSTPLSLQKVCPEDGVSCSKLCNDDKAWKEFQKEPTSSRGTCCIAQ